MDVAIQVIDKKTLSPLSDLQDYTPLPEIEEFLRNHKRNFEPIRDLIICYVMIFSAWLAAFSQGVWWVYCIACLTVTSALVGFIALAHESFHDNLSSKKTNDFIAWAFVALPLLMNYDLEKQVHLNHHKYIGTEKDPTLDSYNCSVKQLWIDLFLRLIIIGSIIWVVRKRTSRKLQGLTNKFSLGWNLLMILEQFAIFCLFMKLAPWAYLWCWVFPLILTSIFSSIREFGEHKSFDSSNLVCIATTHTNIFERLLISQFNFTHHAAHHLFPKVPYKDLHPFTLLLDKCGWPQIQIPILVRHSYLANLLRLDD